jgi:hypothetical protein
VPKQGETKLANNTSEYSFRTYAPGCEASLVLLFNSEYANLAGFVPRTVEYWRWCCLKRPDVEEKGILIAEKGNKTIGYIVVGKSGNVWELCYDSSQNAKKIISRLLTWAVDYSRKIGSDSIVLSAYVKDKLVREVCSDMDFAESPSEPMFLSALDLPQLMCELLRSRDLPSDINGVFWFCLKNCPTWSVSSFGVRIEKKQVAVLSELPYNHRITIEADMSTLVALIFGTESVFKEIIFLKLRFSPFWKILKIHKLMGFLQIKTPWFVPRADMG